MFDETNRSRSFFVFQVNEQLTMLNLSGNQFCEEGGAILGPSISKYTRHHLVPGLLNVASNHVTPWM
jgi:hypothetical protein